MTDWFLWQRNLSGTENKSDCRWMVTAGCLPVLFNEVRRLIFNSAKHFIPFRILAFECSQSATRLSVTLTGARAPGSDSDPSLCHTMNDTCSTLRFSLSREIKLHAKIALTWVKYCWEIELNPVFNSCVALFTCKHLYFGNTADTKLVIIHKCCIENVTLALLRQYFLF